jgi:3'-phosphoadenosine 5'-phosphosulfate sulfotransferase (PAPS reductase)/FAD synthetase
MYEVIHTTPANMREIAQGVTAKHAASFSGGVPSAIMVDRAIARYGRENVMIWFADVLAEDVDLYRFVDDCMNRWGGSLYVYTHGKTPLDVAQDKQMIPCDLHCPCSYDLKVKPFRSFIKAMRALPIVYIGLEAHETKRLISVRKSYAEAIPRAQVDYALLWESDDRSMLQICIEDMGLALPRLYVLGFKHNNCGGACVREGVKEWLRLLYFFPARFAQYEQWEEDARALGGARAERSFCSVSRGGRKVPMPLSQIRKEYFPQARKLLKLDTLTPAQLAEIHRLVSSEYEEIAERARVWIQGK